MRLQTGVRVDAEVWRAYKVVCSRESLRVSRAIEEFLKVAVENGSVLNILSMIREMEKSRVEGYEAYASVLLYWYTHGKFWFPQGEDQAPVEPLLLDAVKMVKDSKLRGQIAEALIAEQRRKHEANKEIEKE